MFAPQRQVGPESAAGQSAQFERLRGCAQFSLVPNKGGGLQVAVIKGRLLKDYKKQYHN